MDAIVNLVAYLEQERNYGRITVAVFLDNKRALDTMSHVHVHYRMIESSGSPSS